MMSFSRFAFVRHFVEMVLAMVVGMVLLDPLAQFLFSSYASVDLFATPGLFAPVMTLNMIIGMALWMLFRRHSLRSVGEMSGAMVLPLCLLIGPHWGGVLSGNVLIAGSMALSLPAMMLVMYYRRDMYGMKHMHHEMAMGGMHN